jgi:hypothetical protein
MQQTQYGEWNARSIANPFAESEMLGPSEALDESLAIGFTPWNENITPFAETVSGIGQESDAARLFSEAFSELRDEAFDEALASLAEETEQAVADRFTNETPATAAERERFGDAHLSGVRFEAEQYLQSLEEGLAVVDVQSLSEEQLDAALDRFDPQLGGELTPAGEEFIGGLVRKAKKAVKFVANTAKKVGSLAGKLLGPVLKRLHGLVKPLLRRVLSFAIGRLPAALQPAARKLAARFASEAGEDESASEASPANLTDVEMLAESFDAALAEAISSDPSSEALQERFDAEAEEDENEGREIERLAEARAALIDRLRDAGEDEDLAPAIEQFVPALLGALRLGINLVGRPKVVSFLAKFLGKLIVKWVGPQLSHPLSSAIVDTGLRLITLEAEGAAEFREDEAAPVALAGVIEDAVRRFSESEDYIFEDEGLMQLAASEALNHAVASNFPQRFVRPGLQQAPSLGGTFITRKPRRVRSFRKYSRVPEVQITTQIADDLPTFGGATVGATLRAAGVTIPMRARMHIYQSISGTTLPSMVRIDRSAVGAGRGLVSAAHVHPLTPAAAGLLLREPRLGVSVPPPYLRSRHRIAVGQRFYVLEPIGATATLGALAGASIRVAAQTAPSRAWIVANLRRGRVSVGIFLSETDAQRVVQTIRQARGNLPLLQALTDVYRTMDGQAAGARGHVRIVREDHEESEDFALPVGQLLSPGVTAALRKRLRSWVLSALAQWARNNAEAFARAAGHPDAGVTVRLRLTGVPGLDTLGQVASAALRGGAVASALHGTPQVAITVAPGRQRK